MVKAKDTAQIERLPNLATSPDAQLAYGLHLIETESHPDVVQAALDVLDVLAATADPRAHSAIVAAYAAFAEGRRRDPGCFARTTLVRALRYVARQDDVGLVERAVMTYEFVPPFTGPTGGEVAAGLRSVALVTLIEIDETLAAYHGVRIRYEADSYVTFEQIVAAA